MIDNQADYDRIFRKNNRLGRSPSRPKASAGPSPTHVEASRPTTAKTETSSPSSASAAVVAKPKLSPSISPPPQVRCPTTSTKNVFQSFSSAGRSVNGANPDANGTSEFQTNPLQFLTKRSSFSSSLEPTNNSSLLYPNETTRWLPCSNNGCAISSSWSTYHVRMLLK